MIVHRHRVMLKATIAVLALAVPLCIAAALLHDWLDSFRVEPPKATLAKFGLRLQVQGGVIRAATSHRATIWAYAPEPAFTLKRAADGPTTYALDILNVRAADMRLRTSSRARLVDVKRTRATVQIALEDEQPHDVRIEYPPEVKSQFTFGIFSDTGGRDGYAIDPRIMRDFAKQPVAFVFSLGDTIGCVGRRLRTRWGVSVFDAFARMAETPVYFIVGDNDLSGWLSDSALPWTSQYGPSNYSFTFGSAHFVMLDSTWHTLSDRTLRWLADDLAQAHAKQVFILMHIPPFYEGPRVERSMRRPAYEKFMAIVKQYPGVHMYAGHLQIRADWERAGGTLHITGSGGERLRDPKTEPQYYSHMRVRWDGKQVENIRVNDGLPWFLESAWWRLRLVYPIWLAAHKWEAIGSLLLAALLVWRFAARRTRAPALEVSPSETAPE